MQATVMNILLNNSLCVLCTCNSDIPDASLMLYICNNQCTKMHMLTLKETTKYLNIVSNKNVSLLIDTRDDIHDEKTTQTKALTIHGVASIVDDYETSKEILNQLIKRHDGLSKLASNASVRVIEVQIKSILFLENVDKVNYISLP